MRREEINNRVKLAHHRLIARALKANPSLVDEAREIVQAWKKEPDHPSFVDAWHDLLSNETDHIRTEIVRRTPQAEHLRISSPFALTPTRVLSRANVARLWRSASQAASEQ